MSVSGIAKFGFAALMIVIWVALPGTGVQAQQRGGTVQTIQELTSNTITSGSTLQFTFPFPASHFQ